MSTSNQDQRNFFRVTDEVILLCKPVDRDSAVHSPAVSHFPELAQHQQLSDFRKLGLEQTKLLTELQSDHPAIANLFKLQNRRLELLANQMIKIESPEQAPELVSLSEGGVAFYSDKPCYKGSHLALSLFFIHSGTNIFCFGEALRVETSKDNRFHIAAKFQRMAEADKTLLARHILQAQRKR